MLKMLKILKILQFRQLTCFKKMSIWLIRKKNYLKDDMTENEYK